MTTTQRAAGARARREITLAMLRDGRRPPRASKFRSAKDYRRKPKHPRNYNA